MLFHHVVVLQISPINGVITPLICVPLSNNLYYCTEKYNDAPCKYHKQHIVFFCAVIFLYCNWYSAHQPIMGYFLCKVTMLRLPFRISLATVNDIKSDNDMFRITHLGFSKYGTKIEYHVRLRIVENDYKGSLFLHYINIYVITHIINGYMWGLESVLSNSYKNANGLKDLSHRFLYRFRYRYFAHWLSISYNLTHIPLVPHICVNELGNHWFR